MLCAIPKTGALLSSCQGVSKWGLHLSQGAAQGCRGNAGLLMLDGLYVGWAPLALCYLCPDLISGLSLPAALSLLPPPTSVAKDMHQTWHTLLLHQEWLPGLVEWPPVVMGGHAQSSRNGFQYLGETVCFPTEKFNTSLPCSCLLGSPFFFVYSCLHFSPFSLCPLLKGAKKKNLIKPLLIIVRVALTQRPD